jgi:hypothetical protein
MGADTQADPPAGPGAGRLKRLASTDWKAKARNVASSLKAEYEAGKQGDETPAKPIWATPQQQLDGLLAVFRQTAGGDASGRGEPVGDATPVSEAVADGAGPAAMPDESGTDADPVLDTDEAEVAEVAAAIRGVDWAGVRAATAGRTTEATKSMKAMADHVDWDKVQPVAAKVSSALIAAIASGQLGVGGRLASTVARTITNQNGLGQRVASKLDESSSDDSLDFRNTIEAAAREG